MSASEFFDMGGYAFFVWTSYGLTAVILCWMLIGPILSRKNIIKELRMKYRQQERQRENTEVIE